MDCGEKKVQIDLIEAFKMIKIENINCIVNYKKYAKPSKKLRKTLDSKEKFIPYTNSRKEKMKISNNNA